LKIFCSAKEKNYQNQETQRAWEKSLQVIHQTRIDDQNIYKELKKEQIIQLIKGQVNWTVQKKYK
jgi:hypothetical protein